MSLRVPASLERRGLGRLRRQEGWSRRPEKQREAVLLVQVQGLSVAEAAVRAGVSLGALKVRAHRGYRALRAQLELGESLR